MAYIEIKNLNYKYAEAEYKSLKNINLNIEKGELLFITGKSGSGKSTLVRAVCGSIPNFYGGTISGGAYIEDTEVDKIPDNIRAGKITMVFQDPERQLMMNKVHREIAFGLENIGVDEEQIKRRVYEAMEFSNITDLAFRDIKSLSGGQKQRVAITSAIAYLPQCIILDEPTSQLDPTSAEEVVNLVKKINEELGITIIVAEHRIDRWFEAVNKIAVMSKGELIFYGNKPEFYKRNELSDFFPTIFNVAKVLKLEIMPESLKALRQEINEKAELKDALEIESGIGEKVIQMQELSCFYKNSEAVKNVNLEINRGSFNCILGHNGAGKSTLLKAVMGIQPYKGKLNFEGKEIKKLSIKAIAKDIGYVSQNPNDYISKDTVYEELKFTLDNYGIKDEEKINEILKLLDLYGLRVRNPRDISGGERQRTAIASILVLEPKVILLDEPTRGLDRSLKKKLGGILKKLQKRGITVVLVTHDIEFAAEFGDNFILMSNGEVVAEGSRGKVLGEGIYYTTSINKLFREKAQNVFTLEEIKEKVETI